ncbi:hypothetical protein O181_035345 [Austropuccinia psidii MF-1]|uniref:Uncharacterized protein n=1 Tax=Austropuccinia psidii MF-1 TaxID=1389203 RepID=A0A9Q3D4K6_9BASI|nr:hypothetical protein [Austropuccinia psidii MF-1]
MTELTDSSPSAPPPSALCGSGILSQLASSGHFDPVQIYNGYKAVEVLDPPCTECLAKGKNFFQHFNPKSSKFHFCFVGKKPCCHPGSVASNVRRMAPLGRSSQFLRAQLLILLQDILIVSQMNFLIELVTGSTKRDVVRWTNVGGSIPVGGRPIYSRPAVPISRINTEGVVERIRRIADSPPDPDAEGSDELDGEEAEVVNNPVGQQSSTSPSQPPAKRFQSRLIPSTPRNFQPILAAIPTSLPPPSPSSSHTRPAISTAVQGLTHSHLPTAPVEEEKSFHLFHFLLPKCFRKGIIGLSE